MRPAARIHRPALLPILLSALLLALLWPAQARAYVKFSVKNHGTSLDSAYIQEVTTLISDVHKSFAEVLRLRVTADVHVALKFYKERTEYEQDVNRQGGMKNYSKAPPAFYRHSPMEIWAMEYPQRDIMTQLILHESTHLFLHNLSMHCPVWLHEGLAESFQGAVLHQGRFVLRPYPQRNDAAKALLASGGLPGLAEYLDLDRDTWQSKDDSGQPMRVVSWSLGWFLLSSDDGRQLLNYLIRTYQDRRTEKCSTLVDRYWRGGLGALEAAWRAWIPGGRAPMALDIRNPEETSLTTLIR